MNILMISTDYPPVPGGISAHVYELSKALVTAGNKVSLITRKRKKEPVGSAAVDIDIYTVPLSLSTLIYGLQIRKFVRKMLPRIQPDIIHIHGMLPLEWYNITHIPLAYTNHTSGYLKRIRKEGLRRMTMLKRHLRKPNLFLAPSKELLIVPFEIPGRKLFIPNGVDGSKFLFNEEKRLQIRRQLGIDEEEIVAIITRRLVDKNGVIYLARATGLLQNKAIRFIIIGDGPERKPVEAEFKKHCGKRAICLGNKSHEEIIDYYSAADFSVLPSLMEATSISGLEAMAAGLPLVGTKVGGIPELIRNGINGYLCNPQDPSDLAEKIDLLLNEDFPAYGKNSRKAVEKNFDWSIIARKTYDAYSTIVNNDDLVKT
ncbi:MAG: glycosyltransferase family 4 protein [Deltaproteobacteria bacterium]|nr:glycosyltransferase family 4 protein [Deltaproteobacteria bacterium]